ncbi:MAG: HigA family addiction module antidote protein [Chloroflexi bacterium]|nr:HigA family addiction module antidote protein [Chloroflexota bacterium]
MTNTKLVETLGVSRKAISSIVKGRKTITPGMALRLSRAFSNTTPESWLNLQRNYDLWYTSHNTQSWKIVQPLPLTTP